MPYTKKILLVGLLAALSVRATPVVDLGLQAYYSFTGNATDEGPNAYALSVTGGARTRRKGNCGNIRCAVASL